MHGIPVRRGRGRNEAVTLPPKPGAAEDGRIRPVHPSDKQSRKPVKRSHGYPGLGLISARMLLMHPL